MADPLIDEMAVLDVKLLDFLSDIDAVSAGPEASAIPLKIAVGDDDRAAAHAAQNPLFIADEAGILHGEVEPLGSYARALVIADLGPGEGDAAGGHAWTPDDESAFVLAGLV